LILKEIIDFSLFLLQFHNDKLIRIIKKFILLIFIFYYCQRFVYGK
jgi:hypothetical protein